MILIVYLIKWNCLRRKTKHKEYSIIWQKQNSYTWKLIFFQS